jgi:dTDP-4-amino-4,6-dideoxygalactose transaminase
LNKGCPNSLKNYEEKKNFEAYRFILPGYHVKPAEKAGVIGREPLENLPGFIEIAKKILEFLNVYLATVNVL